MPSGLVITRLPVPVTATAANKPSSGAHAIAHQALSAADARIVQFMPSGLVITRLPVPVAATAANKPSSGAHAIPNQLLSAADARIVQVSLPVISTQMPPAVTAGMFIILFSQPVIV